MYHLCCKLFPGSGLSKNENRELTPCHTDNAITKPRHKYRRTNQAACPSINRNRFFIPLLPFSVSKGSFNCRAQIFSRNRFCQIIKGAFPHRSYSCVQTGVCGHQQHPCIWLQLGAFPDDIQTCIPTMQAQIGQNNVIYFLIEKLKGML